MYLFLNYSLRQIILRSITFSKTICVNSQSPAAPTSPYMQEFLLLLLPFLLLSYLSFLPLLCDVSLL